MIEIPPGWEFVGRDDGEGDGWTWEPPADMRTLAPDDLRRLDVLFLRMAYALASKSSDPSSQNGALLIDPRKGVAMASGFNSLPPGVPDAPERRQRPAKYDFTSHAEEAAVLDAARNGIRTMGLWIYCPWSACAPCARMVIGAGIRRFVRHAAPAHARRSEWAASIALGDLMLREAGVEIVAIEERLGVKFRFAGEEAEA